MEGQVSWEHSTEKGRGCRWRTLGGGFLASWLGPRENRVLLPESVSIGSGLAPRQMKTNAVSEE